MLVGLAKRKKVEKLLRKLEKDELKRGGTVGYVYSAADS